MAISLPIATVVGGDLIVDSLKHEHGVLLESIKVQRENYGGFCEDEDELNETLMPIEQDPEPYANGSIKTRPILKKYALSLCEKLDLELRMDASAEALRDVGLTPQQVKADMKHYVSLCEKKIASQQKEIDLMLHKMNQMCQAISLLASPARGMSMLALSMNKNWTSVESLLLENHDNGFHDNDILFATSVESISKLSAANINARSVMCFGFPSGLPPSSGGLNYDGIPLDSSTKYYIPLKYNNLTILNIGPFTPPEITCIRTIFGSSISPPNGSTRESGYSYSVTALKIAALRASLDMVKLLHEMGAKIATQHPHSQTDHIYHVPNGSEGDLVAGYLQTHGSAPVVRF
jgi:hypothetical protein